MLRLPIPAVVLALSLGFALIGCGEGGTTSPTHSKPDTLATKSPLLGTWSSNQFGRTSVLTIGADSIQDASKSNNYRRQVGTWVVDADTLKICFTHLAISPDSLEWVSENDTFFNYRTFRLVGDELFLTPFGGSEIRYVRGMSQSIPADPIAAPSILPAGGEFAVSQRITMASSSAVSSIHYTLDGSSPTTSSHLYTTPFFVDTSVTVRAIAVLDGNTSPISIAKYKITSNGLSGTWSRRDTLENESNLYESVVYEPDGSYHSNLVVGKIPQYVRDQGTWRVVGTHVILTITKTEASSDSLTWRTMPGSQSYESIWKLDGQVLTISDTGNGTNETRYVRGSVGNVPPEVIAAPVTTPAGGYYSTPPTVSLATTTKGAVIHYTLNQATPTAESPVYGTPILVDASVTLKTVAIKGKAQSPVTSDVYTLSDGIASIPLIGAWIYRSGAFSETFVYGADGSLIIYDVDSTKSAQARFTRTKGYWSLQGNLFSDSLVKTEWSSDGIAWSEYFATPLPELQKGTLLVEGSQLTRSINVSYGHPEVTYFVRTATPTY